MQVPEEEGDSPGTVPLASFSTPRRSFCTCVRRRRIPRQHLSSCGRFFRSTARDDLDAAVRLWTELLDHPALTTVPAELRGQTYDEAATLFWLAYTASDDVGYLDVIIRCRQAAVPITPSGSPERGDQLTALARGLSERYQRGAEENDIDDAITAYEEALPLCRWPESGQICSLNGTAPLF